jgi:hypothetical protein
MSNHNGMETIKLINACQAKSIKVYIERQDKTNEVLR